MPKDFRSFPGNSEAITMCTIALSMSMNDCVPQCPPFWIPLVATTNVRPVGGKSYTHNSGKNEKHTKKVDGQEARIKETDRWGKDFNENTSGHMVGS